ncbi:MAG: hypothetical protein ABL925_04565 [Methylococcales bacterium]
MFLCNNPANVFRNNRQKSLVYLTAFILSQIPLSEAGTSPADESVTSFITIAKSTEYNTARFCEEKPGNSPTLAEEFAKDQEIALDAAKQELTDQGIQVNWARHGFPHNGAFLPACNVTQTELLAFEIPENKLDQARKLGFKLWNEWPYPIFISLSNSSGVIPVNWEVPPYIAKSSGLLQCDEQGNPLRYHRENWLPGYPGSMSDELNRAGIPVDYAFCAIRPEQPPQNICGQDSGKLDVLKIPESSIPRALALGYQLADIGEIKVIPCMETPDGAAPQPCTAGTQTSKAETLPVAVPTTATAKAYNISFSGALKAQAKLKAALGKAVAQGVLVTYIAADSVANQVNACVEPAANLSQDQFAELIKKLNKQVKSKAKQEAKVLLTQRTETCGSALTASEAAGLEQKKQTTPSSTDWR